MEPLQKATPDRGLSLATTFWLLGSGFILAATASFLAYLHFGLPWWAMVVALGIIVGGIVFTLEQFVARPLERLTRGLQVPVREGELQFPATPSNQAAPIELRRIWRGLRVIQEQQDQSRLARQAAEAQVAAAQRAARVLQAAGRALRPGVSLAESAPVLLRDLAGILGVPAVYLVPLRRHCPVPVVGPAGEPDWADAVRASGNVPWQDVLAQDLPVALSFREGAPGWAKGWGRRTVWAVPLNHHGRSLGLLIALPTGAERAFTREELALLEALAPMLAAGLHPPRWSEERKRRNEADKSDDVRGDYAPGRHERQGA